MDEKNPKSDLKISLKKGKATKKKKIHNANLEKSLEIENLHKFETPVYVKIKEDWVDRIGKYAALSAVLLAIIMALFDYGQSKDQQKTFNSFRQKLDSTFATQQNNAKEQHQKTIATLENQQELMKKQNDSTINLLKIQADRLKTQNGIWKINQKNEILTQRVKIATIPTEYFLRNDSLKFTLNYNNSGQRTAINIECSIGVFIIDSNNQISLLEDEKVPLTMNKIVPGTSVKWYINKDFPGRIGDKNVFIYSSLSYDDEMFQNRFVTSDFMRVFKKDSMTNISFCDEKLIDFIENNSHYRDIEIEDFTIKSEFLFK